MKVSEALLLMKDTLLFKGWTQGSEAVDDVGEEVEFTNPHAVAWCLTGAASYVCLGNNEDTRARFVPLMDAMTRYIKRGICEYQGWPHIYDDVHIPDWNDEEYRTIDQVIQVVDSAIGYAKDDGS